MPRLIAQLTAKELSALVRAFGDPAVEPALLGVVAERKASAGHHERLAPTSAPARTPRVRAGTREIERLMRQRSSGPLGSAV